MIWGDNSVNNVGASNGICWDDNTPKPMSAAVKSSVNGSNNVVSTASKIAKSQTVSVMQSTNTNATSKNTQSIKSIAKTVSTTSLTATTNSSEKQEKPEKGKKSKGKDGKKSGSGTENNNDEFGSWCSKTLAAHSNVIDGMTNSKIISNSID